MNYNKKKVMLDLLALTTLVNDISIGNGTQIMSKVRKLGDEIISYVDDLVKELGLTEEINRVLVDMLLNGELVISEKMGSKGTGNEPYVSLSETFREEIYKCIER